MESPSGSQVELPEAVTSPFEVYVNGVRQQPGVDFDQVGRTLVFRRELLSEGKLGFWRWLSLFMGVAGTYRKNEIVDVVSGRVVVSLTPMSRER